MVMVTDVNVHFTVNTEYGFNSAVAVYLFSVPTKTAAVRYVLAPSRVILLVKAVEEFFRHFDPGNFDFNADRRAHISYLSTHSL